MSGVSLTEDCSKHVERSCQDRLSRVDAWRLHASDTMPCVYGPCVYHVVLRCGHPVSSFRDRVRV